MVTIGVFGFRLCIIWLGFDRLQASTNFILCLLVFLGSVVTRFGITVCLCFIFLSLSVNNQSCGKGFYTVRSDTAMSTRGGPENLG